MAMMFAAAALLGGCSKQVTDGGEIEPTTIPVTFTLATPGSEGVIYPKAQTSTRATHDAAEYAVKHMTLLVYDATETDTPKFLRKHTLDDDITLYDNGNGTYSFSIEAPINDLNAKRKYVFVVNDDASVASTAVSSTEAELHKVAASITLDNGNTADALAVADNGIAMTGTAKDESSVSDVLTVTPGLKCKVSLERIVARIDIQNNTPNMTIESAVLVGAAKQGYLFGQTPLSAVTEDRIQLGSNAEVDLTTPHESVDPFTPKTFKKAFYTYERPNTEDDYAVVRVTYRVNESLGTVDVPFLKTADGSKTPVDITRNHLYTVVLGNGQPVETNPVEFTIRVEDWNLVEMPEEIGPGDQLDDASQKALNAKLKVNMFTEANAKEFDLKGKTITSFYSTDMATALSESTSATASYVTWNDLETEGALTANFTMNGEYYRLPTAGEIALLAPYYNGGADCYYPWWNDNSVTNASGNHTVEEPFVETLYFKNTVENLPDDTQLNNPEYTLTGVSQLKVGGKAADAEVGDDPKTVYYIHPVYGLRFKGTDQYAAYRWEIKAIDGSNWNECYFSIKIKALLKDDTRTTIDDIANEAYWDKNYIEYKFPAIGRYTDVPTDDPDNCYGRGTRGYLWSSTKSRTGNFAYDIGYAIETTNVGCYPFESYFQLRFVKADPQQ